MNSKALVIDKSLVEQLIAEQFLQWKQLPVSPIAYKSWDNRMFHLGTEMVVRLPSAAEYAAQIEKEYYWLPKLLPKLPVLIPQPLAIGEPTKAYPWRWSVYRWLPGECASAAKIKDMSEFARQLANFLNALQAIDVTNGPKPGTHNFYRGGELAIYDAEVQQALKILENKININIAQEIWRSALQTHWQHSPVWVHGDISIGNLLLDKGELSAVIDFGLLAVGDPACDLVIAWTLFNEKSRDVFRQQLLRCDSATWLRGSAWSLWKALIIAAKIVKAVPAEAERCWQVIDIIINSYQDGCLS